MTNLQPNEIQGVVGKARDFAPVILLGDDLSMFTCLIYIRTARHLLMLVITGHVPLFYLSIK
jgi:queuine/archaeosine tRNA-ribosyltransferase